MCSEILKVSHLSWSWWFEGWERKRKRKRKREVLAMANAAKNRQNRNQLLFDLNPPGNHISRESCECPHAKNEYGHCAGVYVRSQTAFKLMHCDQTTKRWPSFVMCLCVRRFDMVLGIWKIHQCHYSLVFFSSSIKIDRGRGCSMKNDLEQRFRLAIWCMVTGIRIQHTHTPAAVVEAIK